MRNRQRAAFDQATTLQRAALEENARLQREILEKTALEHRALTFLNDLLQRIGDLVRSSKVVADLVKKNYTQPTTGWKQQQANAELNRKEGDVHREILRVFLPQGHADQLELEYNRWYDAVFCDDWPCRTAGKAMGPGDTRLKSLEDGQLKWTQYLYQLKRDLLREMTSQNPDASN